MNVVKCLVFPCTVHVTPCGLTLNAFAGKERKRSKYQGYDCGESIQRVLEGTPCKLSVIVCARLHAVLVQHTWV